MSMRAETTAILARLRRMAPSGYFVGLHIRFAAPVMQFQTYSQAWSDFYSANAYALRDPTIAWGFSTTGTTRWSTMPIPDPFGILKHAASFGLVYGAVVSCGPLSSRTIAGFAHDKREFTDDEISVFAENVRRLHDLTEPPDSLTKAQQEALQCVAEGNRHAAAAAKLGITESAFKARLISARERLRARTTAEALQRAKEYRLL